MKLETILKLNDEINQLNETLRILEEEYITQIDNDLYTVDLVKNPCFINGYEVKIESRTNLTKKHLIRFCEDFGLSLKNYTDNQKENKYVYEFEKQKDILIALDKHNI